jgi:hypothetical protein
MLGGESVMPEKPNSVALLTGGVQVRAIVAVTAHE